MQRIEVITGEQKRRRYTPEEKARFVALAMQPGYTVSLVARQYGITPSLLFKWKRLMNEGGKSAIVAGDEVVSVSEVQLIPPEPVVITSRTATLPVVPAT